MKRLIDYDSETLTATWHDYDHETKTTTIAEVQDVDPIVRSSLAIQTHDTGGAMGLNEYSRKGIKNSWWHVARIPNSVIVQWQKQYGVDLFKMGKCEWTAKKVRQLLNSPDWKYLRTGTGRV